MQLDSPIAVGVVNLFFMARTLYHGFTPVVLQFQPTSKSYQDTDTTGFTPVVLQFQPTSQSYWDTDSASFRPVVSGCSSSDVVG